MLFVGGTFYHAHFSDAIRQIDPITGLQIGALFPQSQVVGMALVGSDIWISKWIPRQVGIWDPGTNIFTPVFSTPSNAGALAYDPDSGILWVGRQGGWVEPYDLAGNLLATGFQPFGAISQTIDGLTILGEGDQVPVTAPEFPEPGTMLLLGFGLVGLAGFGRKRVSRKA